jgi:hypothetical protein
VGCGVANPNKARGTAWESAVRDHLNDALGLYVDGWQDLPAGLTKFRNPADPLNVKRQAQEGSYDVGDLHAWPFVVECKDVKNPAVPTWLRQGLVEAKNAGFPYAVVAHKARRLGVRSGRVHIDVRTFTRLRMALGLNAYAFADMFGLRLTTRGFNSARWYFSTTVDDFAGLLDAVRRIAAGE